MQHLPYLAFVLITTQILCIHVNYMRTQDASYKTDLHIYSCFVYLFMCQFHHVSGFHY